MKKCFAKALAALPLLATVVAYADSELATETIGDYTWTYRIVDGNAEIWSNSCVAVSPQPTGSITIPDVLGGKTVTSIGDSALVNCTEIDGLMIPEGVTNIGENAFSCCHGITNVVIPRSVLSIGSGAFSSCSGLLSILVAEGSTAYRSEDGLLLTNDGEMLVATPGGLDNILIPSGVKCIAKNAIGSNIVHVSLPDSLVAIADSAFESCFDLTEIIVPSGVKAIGNWAFSHCGSLTNISLSNGLESIGDYAFNSCENLQSVTIPSSVTNIGESAFYHCNGLDRICIPENVENIGMGAFSSCANLLRYEVSPDNAHYKVFDRLLMSKDGHVLVAVPNDMTHVSIPDGIKRIEGSAFLGCNVEEVNIPNGVIEIGRHAFAGCDRLQNIEIPDSVIYFDGYTFAGCSSLTNVTIPASMTQIGYFSFAHCTSLRQVNIHDGVEYIGWGAFYECDELYDSETVPGVNLVDGWAVGYDDSFYGDLDLTGVCGIADYAFESCQGIVSVIIPENIKTIGSGAFDGCTNLKSVTLPRSLASSIPDNVFSGCSDELVLTYLDTNVVFYVDAANGNDVNDGFSKATAVATLQVAIDRSTNGDKIIVANGVYAPIETLNRRIVIESENGYKMTVIDGGRTNNCALLGGTDPFVADEPPMYGEAWQGTNTVLRGFTLRNGAGAWGAGVTAGTVENCLIADNVVEAYPFHSPGPNGLGGGAYRSILRNCTITGNSSVSTTSNEDDTKYGGIGGGSCDCALFNCIEWDNFDDSDGIGSGGGEWWRESIYENCCLENPLFANPANGDYRPTASSPVITDGAVVAGCETEIAVNRTFYVDAKNGSDDADGISKSSALRSIQTAINQGINGDTIIVADGVYAPIDTAAKRIVIESENGYKTTIIDGGGTNRCACAADSVWESPIRNMTLRGFTLTNGRAYRGGGIVGGIVENCLIVSNVAYIENPGHNGAYYHGYGGGAYGSVLRYCTVVGNTAELWPGEVEGEGAGPSGGEGGGACNCALENCIVWNNVGEVSADCADSEVTSCWVSINPHFADAPNGDYHLLSDSPCVVDGVAVAGCETGIVAACENGMPVISSAQVEAWITDDLAQRFAKPGEDAAGYQARFAAKFGSDPVAAMTKSTDKRDRDGFAMYVWQDYVAGTDPTDTNSVFAAKVEMVNGSPVVTWEPKLSEAEDSRRIYTVYGKTNLTDRAWHSPTNAASQFFKVTVEMR